MNKRIWGALILVLSVLIILQVGSAFAYNITSEQLTTVPPAQYTQITSMNAVLRRVTQTGEALVAITLMGQGNITNINVDAVSVPYSTQNHVHTHYFLGSSNIIVGQEETHRLRRTEASFPNSGSGKQAYIMALGQRTMQGSNRQLSLMYNWRLGGGIGGLKPPRSQPNPLYF